MSRALPIEERLDALGQASREALHQLAILSLSALDILVFRRLCRGSERVKEHLDGPTRDEDAATHAAADEPPLVDPVLDGLRADADESGSLTRRHVPSQSSARIGRDQRLLHQSLDGDGCALVMLRPQAGD